MAEPPASRRRGLIPAVQIHGASSGRFRAGTPAPRGEPWPLAARGRPWCSWRPSPPRGQPAGRNFGKEGATPSTRSSPREPFARDPVQCGDSEGRVWGGRGAGISFCFGERAAYRRVDRTPPSLHLAECSLWTRLPTGNDSVVNGNHEGQCRANGPPSRGRWGLHLRRCALSSRGGRCGVCGCGGGWRCGGHGGVGWAACRVVRGREGREGRGGGAGVWCRCGRRYAAGGCG